MLLVSAFGKASSVLICAGLFRKCVQPFLLHESSSPLRAALASVAVSVYLSQSILSAGLEPRFIVPAIPALISFLAAGVEGLAQKSAPLGQSLRICAFATLALTTALVGSQTFALPAKTYRGFAQVADYILCHPESRRTASLVSSEAHGEGELISAIAVR